MPSQKKKTGSQKTTSKTKKTQVSKTKSPSTGTTPKPTKKIQESPIVACTDYYLPGSCSGSRLFRLSSILRKGSSCRDQKTVP